MKPHEQRQELRTLGEIDGVPIRQPHRVMPLLGLRGVEHPEDECTDACHNRFRLAEMNRAGNPLSVDPFNWQPGAPAYHSSDFDTPIWTPRRPR